MIDKPSTRLSSFDDQAQLIKLLAHPARLAIIDILRDGEHCVCHMEAYLGLRQAYISQQLAVLREAGLIQDRRDGWNVYYRVSDARVYDVLSAVDRMLGVEGERGSRPLTPCPCPHCNLEEAK